MKHFVATVALASGQISKIEIEADNEKEAKRIVETSGQHLLGLKENGARQFKIGRSQKAFNLPVFNQQLLSLLEAGQTVVESIEILGRNDKRGHYRVTFDSLLQALREGNQLSEAMAKLPSVFPALYVAMVKSSETTGSIKASIKRFMQYQGQVNEIRNKLIAAATYPAILLGVGFAVVTFLMFYVLPRFSAIYEDTVSAEMRHGFVQWWGNLVRQHTYTLLAALFVTVVMIVAVAMHPKTRTWISTKVLQAPWIGERIWLLQLARMYRTMGMLLKSGVSVLSAMAMTKDSLPDQMHQQMESAILDVSEGKPFSVSFTNYGLSTEIAQRLLVAGESSGNLDEMMERIADFYDQETSIWIDTAGRFIEPVLMVSIGLIIGLIVLMLYSPIFELANIA